MNETSPLSTRQITPLARYRLAREALDLRTFTVSELAALTDLPENTVYSFLSRLSPQGVTSEALPSATPGRPRKRYTLTHEGVENLIEQNLEIAQVLRAEGLGMPIRGEEAPPQIAAYWNEPDGTAFSTSVPAPSSGGLSPDSLRKLFVDELNDLYSAEKQILQTLPRMVEKASDERLKSVFEEHLQVTQKQVERLHRIFEGLEESPGSEKSRAMEGLLEKGKAVMQETVEPEVRDAALISAAQKVEHYGLAGYGTVRTYAEVLGEKQHAELLQKALDEEGRMEEKLKRLAEGTVSGAANY